jgi:uncharacterized protein YkwD
LALVIAGMLLSACGVASKLEASPTSLPTARIAVRPTTSGIVVPVQPAVFRAAEPRAEVQIAEPSPIATPPPPTAEPSPVSASAAAAVVPLSGTVVAAEDAVAMREALLVVEINQVRAANGLPPYKHSPELSAAARAHSCDLAAHGMISHVSSDGRTLAQRIGGSDPPWEWPSESIAAGTDDPAAVVAMWMDEPPEGWHRRNILDVDQREVGVGYCFTPDDPTGNHHYWTADFSRYSGE